MEGFQEVIAKFQRSATFQRKFHRSNRSYDILEDCDNFGFSFDANIYASIDESEVKLEYGGLRVVDAVRSHDNWKNPGSVHLMMKAYGIQAPYDSFLHSDADVLHAEVVKDEQNRFLASKCVEEGEDHLSKRRIAEALKAFDRAISIHPMTTQAYYQRIRLNLAACDLAAADRDVKTLLQLDPTDHTAQQLRDLIPQGNVPSSSLSIPSFPPRIAKQEGYHSAISKLQDALILSSDRGGSDMSDSSESDSDSDSNDDARSSSSERKSKKRKRSAKKSRSKRDKKSKKKSKRKEAKRAKKESRKS